MATHTKAGRSSSDSANGRGSGRAHGSAVDPMANGLPVNLDAERFVLGAILVTVKGDAISFIVLAGGGQFKITYKGTVSGEDLKFHVIIGDMGEGDLVAKRVK